MHTLQHFTIDTRSTHSMKNFKYLKVLVTFAHFICLFPITINIRKNGLNYNFTKKCYFLRMVLIDLLIVGCILKHIFNILMKNVTLNDVVFIFCSAPIIITILDIEILGYVNKAKFGKLLINLYTINYNFKESERNDYVSLLQLVFVFCYFIYLFTVYYIYYSVHEASIINFGYTLAKFMIFTSTCIYTNLLRIIEADFSKLNHLLSGTENLDLVLPIYSQLVFMCKKINKLYGHQLLLTILTYLIWTIYEMYHLAILWSCTSTNCPRFLIMLALSYTVIQEVMLFTILWNCQNTRVASEDFKAIWYSILIKKADSFCKKKLENYSLQLINHRVVFTAMGLYVLNMEHFFSLLGSLVTLIVILTQFSTSV
ncbi:gustatory receptor 156 [Tribolium castaneum]|uniref:Gustatory receptor n=1 Tax=Tribolium castaneum TaxID=7070 RepID=D6WY92_TRICA|nr:PREDICTED: gustatory receptor candidate 48 isoform X1 [Tribolium castaneum]EFA09288.1 gustatory receptor 156 [Tribolium castaneum]|eukprot:XP_015837744.1 PREDICTED: gustatory receptor candidate 48 isoform X1 [Tribolium castaneum]